MEGHNGPAQRAHGTLRITQRRRAAAGSSPPPPTLTTGTVSHTQRTTAQSVPGCQAANVKAAQSSSFCTTSRPSEPRLSSCMRQILPIAQVTVTCGAKTNQSMRGSRTAILRRPQGRARRALGRADLHPLAVLVGVGRPPLAGTRPAPSSADRQSASERPERQHLGPPQNEDNCSGKRR